MIEALLQTMLNAAAGGGVYALVALGYTLVFSVLGVINFAQGALFSIGGYLTFLLMGGRIGVNGALPGWGLPAGLPFWLALLLITLFAVTLGWLPAGGMADLRTGTSWLDALVQTLRYLVLPVATLTALQLGAYTRYMRGAMIEALRQDYIRTARAKGVPDGRVLWGHAFANALAPVLTVLALSFGGLVSGAVIMLRAVLKCSSSAAKRSGCTSAFFCNASTVASISRRRSTRAIEIPCGGVMSRTVKFSAFGSLAISNGLCAIPRIPDVPPPNRRSTLVPSCTNGGSTDLNPW